MLEARGVHVLRGGRAALAGADLTLRGGEVVALVGPNGAGKSTLFAVLAGELRPGQGAATLDARPLACMTAAELALERAALEQSPSLSAPFSVAELVALGLASAPRAALDEAGLVERAMQAVGVAHLAARAADRVSGGERSRAHLARALAQLWAGRAAGGGRFLLLDEPTAALDLAHQVAALGVARAEAAAGAGVLAVLHDLNLAAAFADRVVILSEGRAVADGPPEVVFGAELLSAVYGTPIAVERGRGGRLRIAPDLPAAAAGASPCETPPRPRALVS